MKYLKIAGIVLSVIVGIAILIGLIAPKNYNIKREAVIQTSADIIYKTVSHYSEFPKWNPWQELDPKMKTTIDGTDGTVGAKYSWTGNDEAGAGSMTITKLDEGKYVEQTLEFLKPFKSTATTYINIEPTEGGQKVTWGMKGENSFVPRIFMTLMGGMDKAIGKDYEKGLTKLKTLCESASQ
ncbi:MAG: SRPBCC family protein [Chitinophagales bacterium]